MDIQKFIAQELVSKTFPTDVGTIEVSEGRNIYTSLRKRFDVLAKESMKAFKKSFATYNDCKDLMDKAADDFQKSIDNVLKEFKSSLISIDRYDMDDEAILNLMAEHQCGAEFFAVYDSICEKISDICQNVESMAAYRENRKNNRGRWEGGTIGGNAINAISHQMDIAALNVASGVAHSLVNMVGNAATEYEAKSELRKIFNDESIRESLYQSVYLSVFNMHVLFAELFESMIDWDSPTTEDAEKAQRLLKNLMDGSISKEKEKDICKEIIHLNPYTIEIYEYIFTAYGDKKGELSALAFYFGLNLDRKKDQVALKFVKTNQGQTEEDAHQAKDKLIAYCKEINLPVSDDLESVQYINEILKNKDLEYRTVDSVICETRELADLAREELPKIQEFMKQIEPPTKDSLLDYEETLLAKRKEFEETFSSPLKKKYMEQIDAYHKDFNDKFCSTRMFKKVDRKQAAIDKANDYVRHLDFTTLDEYEAAFHQFEEYLPKIGLTLADATEATRYLQEEKQRIASGQGRRKGSKFAKNELMVPLILLGVWLVTALIGWGTHSSLISNISNICIIVAIILGIRLGWKKWKNK